MSRQPDEDTTDRPTIVALDEPAEDTPPHAFEPRYLVPVLAPPHDPFAAPEQRLAPALQWWPWPFEHLIALAIIGGLVVGGLVVLAMAFALLETTCRDGVPAVDGRCAWGAEIEWSVDAGTFVCRCRR